MPANLSFNLQGATPFKPSSPVSINLPNTTPQSLSYGGTSGQQTTTPQYAQFTNANGTSIGSPLPTPSQGAQNPGLIPPTGQAVKSHTVTNADGSTVQQTYHPPAGTAQTASAAAPAPAAQPSALGSVTSGLIGFGNTNPASGSQGFLQNAALGQSPSQQNIQNANTTLQSLSKTSNPDVIAAENELNTFNKQNPYMLAAQSNPNVAADVASGRDALLGQTFAAEQAARALQVQNALANQQQQISAASEAGNQGLTGQGQQITAANEAGSLGLTGQGQNIQALQNAGNLSQPVSQFGVLGTPQSVGAFGSNSGSAAFQGGFIGGQQQAGQTAAQMSVANTAAKGIEGTIQQYLSSNPQLNTSASTIANAAQQWVQGKQLGDPAYQTLFNYLNEYISTLAPILGVGGDTTNLKTEIAQSFINAKASGQSISQVLQNIGSLADQKLQNIVSAGQGGGQVAGGVPAGQTPTSFSTSW